MKKISATVVGIALLATPAFAGGYGYHEWDEPPYGCSSPGACRLPGPGFNGYYGVGGNGYGAPRRPPFRRLVPVEPFACHNPMYVPSAQRWVCPPVNVRPE